MNLSGGVKSADRYMAGWQSDYKISDRTFAFGGLRYERDRFHLESGSDDTLQRNFVGLDARQNTKPPSPRKKTDTVTTVNLVYAL